MTNLLSLKIEDFSKMNKVKSLLSNVAISKTFRIPMLASERFPFLVNTVHDLSVQQSFLKMLPGVLTRQLKLMLKYEKKPFYHPVVWASSGFLWISALSTGKRFILSWYGFFCNNRTGVYVLTPVF